VYTEAAQEAEGFAPAPQRAGMEAVSDAAASDPDPADLVDALL